MVLAQLNNPNYIVLDKLTDDTDGYQSESLFVSIELETRCVWLSLAQRLEARGQTVSLAFSKVKKYA